MIKGRGAAISSLYANYRWNSRRRGIEFDITRDEFIQLIFSDCSLCGREPSNSRTSNGHTLRYSGIDRTDNNRGYISGNVSPCCKTCNSIKSDRDLGELKLHLQKMIARMK